jgi:hypothetical protein
MQKELLMSEQKVHKEEFEVTGDAVIAKIKEIIHEGNVRRITIKNDEGKTLIEIPLTLGVVGALLLPVWAAIGAIAALAANLTLVIEKVEPATAQPEEGVEEQPE